MQDREYHPLIVKHLNQIETLLRVYSAQISFQYTLSKIDEALLEQCRERMGDIMHTVGRICKSAIELIDQAGHTEHYESYIQRIRKQQRDVNEASDRLIRHLRRIAPTRHSTLFLTAQNVYTTRHRAQMVDVLQ